MKIDYTIDMDIGSWSEQQLVNGIIFLGAGVVMFGVLFVFSGFLTVRNLRAKQKKAKTAISEPPPLQMESNMSLLKGNSKFSQKQPVTEPTPSVPEPVSDPLPAVMADDDYRELLRVLVHPKTQAIVVEVDGQRYETLKKVGDKRLGRRIVEAAAALLHFTGGLVAGADGAKSYPKPKVHITEMPPVATDVAPAPPKPEAEIASTPSQKSEGTAQDAIAEMAAQRAALQASLPEKEEKRGFLGFGGGNRKAPAPEVPMLNLAGQIDEIAQRKLWQAGVKTPVKISSGPDGGIEIAVGSERYHSVDAIDDINIRGIIQESIDQWSG